MSAGIALVDTTYLRQSAQEIGGILKDAVSAQLAEVEDILSLQAQTVQAAETLNMMDSSLGGAINILG